MKANLPFAAAVWAASILVPCHLLPADDEIGFIERFALASDREKVLSELAPGTEEFYYYHALHYQNVKNASKLAEWLGAWRKDFPKSGLREIIENRDAILAYDTDPQRTLKFLKEKLELRFNHQQEARDSKPDLPTSLDPAKVSRDVFLNEALRHDNLQGVSESELERMVTEHAPLSVAQIRALVSRLSQPVVPGLVELIAADLQREGAPAFGAFQIHTRLLPEQLDALAKLAPQITKERAYVHARLRKIQPVADSDPDFDLDARQAWLDRLWSYAKDLPNSFNSTKAAVLYQRLDLERHKGLYNKEHLLEYLRLPRRVAYLAPRWEKELTDTQTWYGDLNASNVDTGLPFAPIGDDESLVRDYFLNLFANEALPEGDSLTLIDPYADWVNLKWLKPILAEALIVSGKDKPERWSSLLSAGQFQALKDRVDVEFALQNRSAVTPGEDVSIDLYLKNVPKLIVRIYEINTLSFYLQQNRQLNTDLQLDGLVANVEATHTYDEAPFLRTRRSFQFPELKGKRGAWIIEFIGGGRSSRSLIRTPQWHLVQRTGPAGEMLQILDEKFQPIQNAAAWLDGRRFTPSEKTGVIQVPFTNAPGPKPIVIASADGSFASLAQLYSHGEDYHLDSQFYLNREQLLSRREATLAIRSTLLSGAAIQPLALLKDVKLSVSTTTLDGVKTNRDVASVNLEAGKDFTYTFAVPDRVVEVAASLSGEVEQISQGGQKKPLQANQRWPINTLEATESIYGGHISQFGRSIVYELLGKNGEPVANKQVNFAFQRKGFATTERVDLRTDDHGRIQLGELDEALTFTATAVGSSIAHWDGPLTAITRDKQIQCQANAVLDIPLSKPFSENHFVLLKGDGDIFTEDWTDHIQTPADPAKAWHLSIKDLTAGDYLLHLRDESVSISIKVLDGPVNSSWVFGRRSQLEIKGDAPLNIESTQMEGDSLMVQLSHFTPLTRVHVAASRFTPQGSLFRQLADFHRADPAAVSPPQLPNLFSAGREIGDEYRYILDRHFNKIYPGNMLTRPGMLLNPWEVRSTGQTDLSLKSGEAAGLTKSGKDAYGIVSSPMRQKQEEYVKRSDFDSGIDFLAETAPLLLNLAPDEKGLVRIPKKEFKDRQFIEIYAENLQHAVERVVVLSEAKTQFQDLRLTHGLDAAKPFAEKKQATVLQTGESLTLADIRTSELESYDTLGGIFSLYTTLSSNAELAKFAWILEWPKLSADEKLARYSEFACHELSFFLSRKDPVFFGKVIKPYLANKKEKTFLDHYLLGDDLHRYLEPWNYSRLNAAEQALLARRLPEETASTARHLRELWELLPPNEAEEDRLFETALRGRALESNAEMSDSLGRVRSSTAEREVRRRALTPSPPPPASPAPGMAASSAQLEILADARPVPGPTFVHHAFKRHNGAGYDTDPNELAYAADKGLTDLLRSDVRPYYLKLGPVKEWAENNYWHLPASQQGPELISDNAFWRDLAEWDGKGAFVSPNLAQAHRSFAEMMLALGVLDLPFEAPHHESKIDNEQMRVNAAGPVIIYHKEILPVARTPEGQAQQLLLSQAFFRQGDRYRMEGDLKFDKYVTKEFLTGVVYGANIVVTNPSSAPIELDLLLQIPQGALPVLKSRSTSSQHLVLYPYTTKTFECYFYFPQVPVSGASFGHYPVNASAHGTALAAATPFSFHVVAKLGEQDTSSWEYVSQYGSDAEALAFLNRNNIERLDLTQIAWRCRRDVAFFRDLIQLLERRHHYDSTIYGYAVFHNLAAPLSEYLRHEDDLLKRCGNWLDSRLLKIDPIERRTYEQLEYAPLVNPRIHRIGAERRLTTPELRTQYLKLLDILAEKPGLDAMDEMSVVYYLFLQDRIEEALERFRGIKAEELPTKLQYDYFHCYAGIYENNLAEVRGIAHQHANEKVKRWRDLFAEVSSQLDEIEGKAAHRTEKPDREKAQEALTASEPSFEFQVEKQTIGLSWKNLKEVTVNYYLLDPEFAFSSSPFTRQGMDQSSIIKPNRSVALLLPADRNSWEIPLPGEYARANVLIETLGAGLRKALVYHSNSLKLDMVENYGRLEVRDAHSDKPLSKSYVKVYARLRSGAVRFFKDGYTDLRGRFDYASLNSAGPGGIAVSSGVERPGQGLDYQALKPGELDSVMKLAVLVLSDSNGAEVREVAPSRASNRLREMIINDKITLRL